MSDSEPVSSKRSRRRGVVLTLVLLVGVWTAAALVTAALAYRDLDAAREAVLSSESTLRDLELADARSSLVTGAERAHSASQRLRRPHLFPLRFMPVVSSNLNAVTVLSDAVRDTAGAAVELLEVAERFAGDTDDQSDDRRLPVEDFASLAPVMRNLVDTLERTTGAVEASDSRWLVGRVAEARATYLELVRPRMEEITLAADATEALPIFLGDEQPRRYLVGAASLSELRATGGLFGSWTVLNADDGRLDFGEFAGIDELEEADAKVTSPSDDFTRRYGDRGSLRFWRNANFTPDFPSAAQVWLELWEAEGRPPLDGVVMVDAVTFERLVERSGPIEVAGVTTLEPGETVRFVGLDAYAAFESNDERKQVLGAVATSAFRQVLDAFSEGDVAATIGMLADLTQGGHLLVYSRDARVQDVATRAGIGGALPDVDGEFAAIFVSNLAANKVDYFTERHVEHRVRLLADGATGAAIDVEFHNKAPDDGYPRYVLGPWVDDVEAGDNVSAVTFVCGTNCEIGPLPEGMRSGGTELGQPMADVRIRIPAGERRRIEYRTETADGWSVDDGDIVVTVNHTMQPTLHDSTLRVVLEVPDGFEPLALPDGTEIVDGQLVWEQAVSGDVQLHYRLAEIPDGETSAAQDRS